MAPRTATPRFVLRPESGERFTDVPFGAWWPQDRQLADQLGSLFGAWPPDQPRINRVLYSPPDWDDRPRKVLVDGHWVKTGNFPSDDTHSVVLSLSDGSRRTIMVIDPAAEPGEATRILENVADPGAWSS